MGDIKEIMADAEYRMGQSIEALIREMMHIRAGQANAGLIDHITVDAYGSQMPINQMATISTPDAQTILISPYDKGQVATIEKAINTSDLGLMPNSDGSLIRINVPPLTEDRRKELVKAVHKHAEEGRVALRNIRRDANEHIKKLEKSKELSEDLMHTHLDEVDKLLEGKLKALEAQVVAKEKDMTEF